MSQPESRMPAGPPPLKDRIREVAIDLALKLTAYWLYQLVERLLN